MTKCNSPKLLAVLGSRKDQGSEYAHIWIDFYEIRNESLPMSTSKTDRVYCSIFDDIRFSGQLGNTVSRTYTRKNFQESVYGYTLGCTKGNDLCPLSLEELERYRAVLKKIEQKLNKLTERFGTAKNFTEQALRILDTLGIECLSEITPGTGEYKHYYRQDKTRVINNRIESLLQELNLLEADD